ncbi:glycoside hydrolase family 30 protein [Mycena polygramma]|nr:glycoside hydrolase family 30 protein [Mycena polygramma]
MHIICFLPLLGALLRPTAAQQISDIRQTLHDKSQLFAPLNLSRPVTFTTSSSTADITVDETTSYQTVKGFGATLTDGAAQTLSQLKAKNPTAYSDLLKKLFDPTFGAYSAGITYLRVPLGASDFSQTAYTYDDNPGDKQLAKFNIDAAPSYVFEVLNDIQGINNILKVHVCPWTPPGWMKTNTNKGDGGNFSPGMTTVFANYLLKALQGFESKGVHVYAISIQNEPLNQVASYPSCKMTYQDEGAIGKALRPLMKSNGFSAVKLIGFEHNWSSYSYPISLMKSYSDVFDGVSFHCYGGQVANQDNFFKAYPDKDIYFTECTGMDGGGWWGDLQWQTDNIFIGAIENHAQSALMWELVSGNELKTSSSCGKNGKKNQCRAVVTVNSDGTSVLKQEYYGIAQAAYAVLPQDAGGAFGQLIKSTVSAKAAAHLRVNAFATARVKPTDPTRYSLHVLNTGGKGASTVSFRGKQFSYSFPEGVTTLHFYDEGKSS